MQETSKDLIKELSKVKSASTGTSLVPMHIPSNYQISLISKKLTNELSTASNIKDKTVQKNTISALKSAIIAIKSSGWNVAPENGFVMCSGVPQCCI